MITSVHLRIRSIYVMLVLVVLSSCHSSRKSACPEIDTDHPRTRRYNRDISLTWNHSRKNHKKTVLIRPGIVSTTGKDTGSDMTLLERNTGEQAFHEKQGFMELNPVRSLEENRLVASVDETYTGPPGIIRPDGSVKPSASFDLPSEKEARKIRRDIRREVKESFRSGGSGRSHQDDTIMLFAVTSFVLGIIGIFTMPLLLGLLATIFGAVALGMIRREGTYYGRGLALAGLIIGIVLLVVGLILLPFAILYSLIGLFI